jgi:hypothetical protein
VPIAFGELSMGIAALALRSSIMQWMKDHQEALNVTDEFISNYETFHKIFAFTLLGLFTMEVLRFKMSSSLRQGGDRDVENLERLLQEEEDDDMLRREQREVERQAKYSAQKDYFKEKYSQKTGYGAAGDELNQVSGGGGAAEQPSSSVGGREDKKWWEET